MFTRLKSLKNRESDQGFTIIEVMIVLAIAGLILLIVFLAVPALQRNARNTQRKNDAAGVLAAVSEYADNNGGAAPTNGSFAAPTLTLCKDATCNVAADTDAQSTAKLGYYTGYNAAANTAGSVSIQSSYSAPSAANDSLTIYEGAVCSNATTAAAGSTRSFVALYGIESNGGYVWQCTGS